MIFLSCNKYLIAIRDKRKEIESNHTDGEESFFDFLLS